jgi:uncharacterized repeat protein (TIGR01451 family)
VSVTGFKGIYTVTLSNISGDGTLAIAVDAGAGADLAGNLSAAAGPSAPVVVDGTAPVVTVGAPSASQSKAGPVSWLVTVADANLAALTPGPVELVGKPGAITGTVSVAAVDATHVRVTVSNITGGTGTLGLRLPAGWVTDRAGNPSAAAVGELVSVGEPHKLRVAVVPPPAAVAAGSTHAYVIGYRNAGRDAAAGAYLEVTLPANATFNPAASSAGWAAVGHGRYRLDLGTVAGGVYRLVRFGVTFDRLPVPTRQTFGVSISDDAANGRPLMSAKASTVLAKGRTA